MHMEPALDTILHFNSFSSLYIYIYIYIYTHTHTHAFEGYYHQQYDNHLIQRADSVEKTLILGKIEGKRRRGWQRMRCLNGITDSIDMSLSKLQEIVKDRKAGRSAHYGITKSWTWLSDWTTTKIISNNDSNNEGNRRWNGWMASLTQWTWTWANSWRWWWIGKPGVWQSMGVTKSQTQLDWTTITTNH